MISNTNSQSAGHETTACAIIWAFHELSRRPDLQQRLRAEVTQMLETTPEPSYSDIDKLPFLNNFVYETLRLYCPGKFLFAPLSNP